MSLPEAETTSRAEAVSGALDEGAVDAPHREAWNLFWRIFVADKARRWGVLSDMGLTPMQGMAISHLDPEEPIAMSTLAERMHCDNSNVTGIADRLEALELAVRRPSPKDRRVRVLALTDKGVALKAEVERRAGEPPPGIMALSDQEARMLHFLLEKAAAAQPGA